MSFPRYPEYRDSGVDWLGEVPKHWSTGSIRWLARRYSGGTPDKTNPAFWEDGTVPWLNSGAVNDRLISEPSTYITEDAFNNSSAKWIPEGALVMALAGQGKTKGMVAQLAFASTCNQSMAAIIPGSEISSRFLYWWLESNYQNIRNMAGGDLRDGLNLELLGDIKCPLPLAEEQRSITTFLDRETAKIDTLVAEQEKLIALLQEEREAVISHAVTKGLDPNVPMKDSGVEWLGALPVHWEVKRVKHVKAHEPNSFVDGPFGSNLKSEHYVEDGDVYVIESSFATQGVLDTSNLKTISREHFKSIDRSEARAGDIIIAKIGAQFGKCSILPILDKPSVVSGNSLKLSVNPDVIDVGLMCWQLVNLKQVGAIDLIVNLTAQPALSLGTMNELPILVPPATEQIQIVRTLALKLEQYDTLTTEARTAITLLQERRAALISAAVTGQIDVRQWVSQPEPV